MLKIDPILIIDDEETYRTAIFDALKEKGYKCIQAANIDEAEDILKRETFSLVVLDLHIPGTDWKNNINIIRRVNDNIFALTGYDDYINQGSETLKCGAKDFIVKPCEREDWSKFIEKIDNLLKIYHVRIDTSFYGNS